MIPVNEQFAAFGKSQLETILKTVELASDHLEKFTDVQVKAAKAAYADGLKTVKHLTTLKDVGEVAAYSSGLAQPALDKTTDYAKSVYEVVATAQASLASMVEAIKTAEQPWPGKTVEVIMGKDDGRVMYKVEIVDGKKTHKVHVDAITGQIHEIK